MQRLALVLLFGASFVQAAAAQNGDRWLIVPIVTSGEAWMAPTTTKLYDELSARGMDVWNPEEAVHWFEASGSAPAPIMTEDETVRWTAESEAILEALVRGEPETAHARLTNAKLLSLPKVTALNRNDDGAQRVLDTCLLGVRALLERGSTVQAQAMARKCQRLVVAGEPSFHMHPPSVLSLWNDADEERRQQRTVLQVRSEPSACRVRLNGRDLGVTPFEMQALHPGRYMVQVECDPAGPGRAHYVEVRTGLTQVVVDSRFDDSVGTRPTLALWYPSRAQSAEHGAKDAASIAKVVPASALVVVSTPDGATLELIGAETGDRRAFARVKRGKEGPTRGDIALAARALIEEQCMDLTTLPPKALPCGDEAAESATARDWPTTRMPRGKFISGMTLLGTGSASLLTAAVLLGPRARASEDWVGALDAGDESAAFQEKWFNMGVGQLVTSSVGGAALVTAMPLVLPKREQTPWWVWFSGGIGVGAAAFSVAYGVTAQSKPGTSCGNLIQDANDARTCVARSERISVTVLTGATAAPLLTIPLVYLLRPSKSKLVPKVELSRAGGYVGVRGKF